MGEVVNVVVAFAVIVFIVRWAIRGGGDREETRRARNLLGFQPKHVTTEMISTVQTMFPDVPRHSIHYDLLGTGSVEITSNKLLERGYLEAPPPNYFQLYPAQPTPAATAAVAGRARNAAAVASSSRLAAPTANLITRFALQDRLVSEPEPEPEPEPNTDASDKAVWEETSEKREASLRERKAQMILAARRRLLAQQRQTEDVSS